MGGIFSVSPVFLVDPGFIGQDNRFTVVRVKETPVPPLRRRSRDRRSKLRET